MELPATITMHKAGSYEIEPNLWGLKSEWDIEKIKQAGIFPSVSVTVYSGNDTLLIYASTFVHGEGFSGWIIRGLKEGTGFSEWDLPFHYKLMDARNKYLADGGFEAFLKEMEVEPEN